MKDSEDTPHRTGPLHMGQKLISGALGQLGRAVTWALPGMGQSGPSRRNPSRPGSVPGIESFQDLDQAPSPEKVSIKVVDYSADQLEVRDITDPVAFLEEPESEATGVRWIDVGGVSSYVVERLRRRYGFHTLAAEDVLRVPQRPKVEVYEECIFLVLPRLSQMRDQIGAEQVSILWMGNVLITFHEGIGDVWESIRSRLERPGSRLRTHGVPYLIYAILDAVIDNCFPVLEDYGEYLQELEEEILEHASLELQRRIHATKRDLVHLRRLVWPVREMMASLLRDEEVEIPEKVRVYLRDVYDHAVQVMDVVETYREMVGGLHDLYMSAVSNRMNEVMKVLTLMASFFIPITFIAGVYGMNFENIPELQWEYSYYVFWGICLTVTGGLAVYFWRKGWLGH